MLVTASREWRDRQRMRSSFLAVQRRFGAPAAAMGIVHGAARGGDQLADDIAAELGWMRDPVSCTAQEWARYGRSAGHRRNARMIRRRAYVGCVAFPLGLSAGTRGCMVAAADAGISVWNRGDPPLADGLYRVTHGQVCAGFEVRRGVVVDCAPILRQRLTYWWRTPHVCRRCRDDQRSSHGSRAARGGAAGTTTHQHRASLAALQQLPHVSHRVVHHDHRHLGSVSGRPAQRRELTRRGHTVSYRDRYDLARIITRELTCSRYGHDGAEFVLVDGRYSESVKCGPRCRNAVGTSCYCDCGGEKHGAGHPSW